MNTPREVIEIRILHSLARDCAECPKYDEKRIDENLEDIEAAYRKDEITDEAVQSLTKLLLHLK